MTALPDYREYPVEEMQTRADAYYAKMNRRHTVREFSDRPVHRDIKRKKLSEVAAFI